MTYKPDLRSVEFSNQEYTLSDRIREIESYLEKNRDISSAEDKKLRAELRTLSIRLTEHRNTAYQKGKDEERRTH